MWSTPLRLKPFSATSVQDRRHLAQSPSGAPDPLIADDESRRGHCRRCRLQSSRSSMGLVMLITIDRLRESRSLVRHTLEVMRQAEAAGWSHPATRKPGSAAILLTSEDRYLEPYRLGSRGDRARHERALRALTTRQSDPAAPTRCAVVDDRLEKFSELERTIAFQQSGQASAALDARALRFGQSSRWIRFAAS